MQKFGFVCSFLQWCEDHSYCTGRLKLSDFLVKPMQRVTKYPLLVKAVYNKTHDSDVKERLEKMVSKCHKNNKQSQTESLKTDIKLHKDCMNHKLSTQNETSSPFIEIWTQVSDLRYSIEYCILALFSLFTHVDLGG